jgi:outer membrane protein assembly factor BamB
MAKKRVLIPLLTVLAAAAAYGPGGLRVALDGTGAWPRFVSRAPDFDALEADRARQREHPLPSLPSVAGADEPQRLPVAAVTGPQVPDADRTARDARLAGAIGPAHSYWPDFRGPGRDGEYRETPIRTDWPKAGLPRLWKHPIGLGYASFVVADGRAFTIEQRRRQEVVAAYDVETGRELWTDAWEGEFVESMGGDGPRATPTYRDGRVYALGALGELRCLDAKTGALLWHHNILTDNGAPNLSWGMAASPLIVDDTMIVLPGGPRGRSVAAYDRMTGQRRWTALDDRQAYTSPMLVTIAGTRQILIVSASRAMGLTVDGGHVLWEHAWSTDMGINVAQPLLLGNDRVFLSAGYGHGAVAFEVTRKGDALATRTIWQNSRMKNKFTSSVLHRGYIYGLDEAILACLDAATGEQKWKGGRYGYGQILLAGDHLIVVAENGDVALVQATPERHNELARFRAIEGKTWNHPVIADGRLLVRNLREMAAFDIRPNSGPER